MKDPLVEMIEKARAVLLKRHGSFEAILRHVQELDDKRILRAKSRQKPSGRTRKAARK